MVFIKCSTNNKAATVYDLFLQAVQRYGLPPRVRCDQGGENTLVAQHMLCHCGSERRSVLVRSSVHNQRIERLWRDMHCCVSHFLPIVLLPRVSWATKPLLIMSISLLCIISIYLA